MQRSVRLSLSLSGVAALALSNGALLPASAQEAGGAEDLGVMEINLKDAINFNWGFQGALQGAGTPNQAGIGGFLPLSVGDNSVLFVDALANVNFADYGGYSSIINTEVAGTTISTSSRLGYRWLNNDRSWMFGVNAGYDSRPMNTGNADTGVDVTHKRDVFFQQVAAGLEAVSESWNFNAYGLFPVGDTEQVLNDRYRGGALHTYGLDVGYAITPEWDASIGYYYQHGDDLTANDANGVLAKLAYEITDGLRLGFNVSYDEAFETRVSGNIEYRFGSGNATEVEKKKWQTPVIQALTESVKHRDVRVHDANKYQGEKCKTGSVYRKHNGRTYHCKTTWNGGGTWGSA
ncbi:putative carbamoyl-phosphate synthase L chain [Synechococcus sp. BIOS-E4-1]|uniref:carbamoyl-phosphate synthase n=1 Tax=Synechococcus sp. BIOS-E4-1 TaxID=1400864 RepID=UPI001861853A|nr:carbamoyl-phosphate synthase [Synechococcus sp. BIOS-E4-1]QNI53759.1 putative carbamoyl-phosphate synthase L chain [Synechococcus sp. BIOS-E4-1]